MAHVSSCKGEKLRAGLMFGALIPPSTILPVFEASSIQSATCRAADYWRMACEWSPFDASAEWAWQAQRV
jgi:hypothetical protein